MHVSLLWLSVILMCVYDGTLNLAGGALLRFEHWLMQCVNVQGADGHVCCIYLKFHIRTCMYACYSSPR